jgi:hypothetical protein
MNTAKIAGLYAAAHYDLIVKYSGADSAISETFAWGLHRAIWFDDRKPSADALQPEKYKIAINDGGRNVRMNVLGDKEYGLADTFLPKRVFEWARGLMPADDNERGPDMMMVSLHARYSESSGKDAEHVMRLAERGRFGGLVRGILAYENKRRKYFKKTLKQLEVYHLQLLAKAKEAELNYLRSGHWLGADKALATATRIDEPTVPFMGDANISPQEHEKLLYWAVGSRTVGMDTSFPTGTGVALKKVARAKQLVDGAIYLHQQKLDYGDGRTEVISVLGRLDLSRKTHGMLPIFRDEAPDCRMATWAAWSDETINVFRVTHYTTHNGAAPVTMVAETQSAAKTSTKPRQRRALAHAA